MNVMDTAEHGFLEHVRLLGFRPTRRVEKPDGTHWRLTETGKDDHVTAVLYAEPANDGSRTGVIRSFRDGKISTWVSGKQRINSIDRQRVEQRRQQAEADGQAKLASSKMLYDKASPCEEHPYLSRKRVSSSDGVRICGDNLLIPMTTLSGEWRGYQRIALDGSKQFSSGSVLKDGGCYVCGDITTSDIVGVAEGYATAQTILRLTNVPTVVSFSCSFFSSVVAAIKSHFPNKKIIIFPDTGESHKTATEITDNAKLYGCIAPQNDSNNYDWNDAMIDNMESAEKTLKDGLNSLENSEYKLLSKLLSPSVKRMQDLQKRCGTGLLFGVKLYQNDMSKSDMVDIRFRGLTVVSARTAGGKTLALVSLAAQYLKAIEDGKALFVTLEEPEHQLYTRLNAAICVCNEKAGDDDKRIMPCHVVQNLIAGHYVDRKDAPKRFNDAAKMIEDRVNIVTRENFEYVEQSDVLCALIKEFRQKYGEKAVVFIDYAQLIRPSDDKAIAGWTAVKSVMDDIRKVIAETGAVIIMAAQMNRIPAGEAKGDACKEFELVQCEHLREGADFEQAAELIMYVVADQLDEYRSINLKVMKYRGGRTDISASFPTYYESSFVDFSNPSRATLISMDTKQVPNQGKSGSSRQKANTRRPPSGVQLTCGE